MAQAIALTARIRAARASLRRGRGGKGRAQWSKESARRSDSGAVPQRAHKSRHACATRARASVRCAAAAASVPPKRHHAWLVPLHASGRGALRLHAPQRYEQQRQARAQAFNLLHSLSIDIVTSTSPEVCNNITGHGRPYKIHHHVIKINRAIIISIIRECRTRVPHPTAYVNIAVRSPTLTEGKGARALQTPTPRIRLKVRPLSYQGPRIAENMLQMVKPYQTLAVARNPRPKSGNETHQTETPDTHLTRTYRISPKPSTKTLRVGIYFDRTIARRRLARWPRALAHRLRQCTRDSVLASHSNAMPRRCASLRGVFAPSLGKDPPSGQSISTGAKLPIHVPIDLTATGP